MKKLSSFLLFACLSFFPAAASAQVPPTPPNACFGYSLADGFEGASASQWSPWNVSQTGVIKLGMTSSARSGSSAALFSFNRREPNGGFMLIDKLFNVNAATSKVRFPRFGCSMTVPWPPVGSPVNCSASAWIRPAAAGASGTLQLIDAPTWTYLTSKPFSFTGAGNWTKVTTDFTGACNRDLVVRIVLARDSVSSEAMVVDDVQVNWYFL